LSLLSSRSTRISSPSHHREISSPFPTTTAEADAPTPRCPLAPSAPRDPRCRELKAGRELLRQDR
jgi:hypothetical protein